MKRLPDFKDDVEYIDVYRRAYDHDSLEVVFPNEFSYLVDWQWLKDNLLLWCKDSWIVDRFLDFVWCFYAGRLYRDGKFEAIKDKLEREDYELNDFNWVFVDSDLVEVVDGDDGTKRIRAKP